MSTDLKWSKTGLRLVCDVPARPAPRTRTSYPMPSMPVAAQYLAAALETITGAGAYTTGIRLTSVTQFPGSTSAVYNVVHVATQGDIEQTEVLSVTYPVNLLITAPLSGATHTFALVVSDGSQTTKYAAVSIQTPADTTAQQIETAVSDANDAKTGVDAINSADALTNADKIALMESWRAELQTQASLDASADALLITTEKTAYDNAIMALSVGLIAAGAPSNWASVWPDGSTLAATGIMTSLSGWWATIASKRATLQVAISQAQSSAAQAAAISAAAQDALNKANAAQIKTPSIGTFASTALPTLPNGSYVAGSCWLTTDAKEYQVTPDGTAWQPVAFYATALIGQLVASQIIMTNTQNLIPNPNSEQAAPTGGWPSGAYEAAGLHTGDAYSGTKCRINTGGDLFVTGLIPVKPGQAYYVEGQVSISSASGYAYIIVTGHNANGGYVGNVANTSVRTTADGYALCKGSGTVPAGVAFIRADLYVVGCWAVFDELGLYLMHDASLIVDGTLQALFARIARAIQSTNYVAGSAGNSPVGFCLSATPFTTTFKDGTTDSGCLMELGGSANFGGYKVATINTQVMTQYNRIQNGSFWRGAFAPWSAQPHWSYALVAAPGVNTTYPLQTVVTAVQSFNAPGYTSGTVYLKFTPSASFVRNSGGGSGSIAVTVKVYLRNHSTGVETLVYSGSGNASYPSPATWAPGQQSINVTSYLSAAPAGYGLAVVMTAYLENNNSGQSVTTTYTGTIDVTNFELVF